MEENKLYIKVGTYTNEETHETIDNCILGYFICFARDKEYFHHRKAPAKP